jgi:hypothetical protein
MGNGGWHGTKEEWQRIESPLVEIDPIIEEFAKGAGFLVTKNLKDWPERSLRWEDDVWCLIQLYLENQRDVTFNLWLCATFQKENRQYLRQEFLFKDKPVGEFRRELSQFLREGRAKLLEWSQHPEQFAVVGDIGS